MVPLPDRSQRGVYHATEAIWFDGYNDRVIYDEAGLFDYTRVEAPSAAEAVAAK